MSGDEGRQSVRVGDVMAAIVVGVIITILVAVGSAVILEVQFATTSNDLEQSGASTYFGLGYLLVLIVASWVTYELLARRS